MNAVASSSSHQMRSGSIYASLIIILSRILVFLTYLVGMADANDWIQKRINSIRDRVAKQIMSKPVAPRPPRLTIQEMLRQAKKSKVTAPNRSDRVNAVMAAWLDKLAEPDTDPVEFILRKLAEIVVDNDV